MKVCNLESHKQPLMRSTYNAVILILDNAIEPLRNSLGFVRFPDALIAHRHVLEGGHSKSQAPL